MPHSPRADDQCEDRRDGERPARRGHQAYSAAERQQRAHADRVEVGGRVHPDGRDVDARGEQPGARDNGDHDQNRSHQAQAVSRDSRQDQGPREVELLLDRDAPQRVERGRHPWPGGHAPIPGEQRGRDQQARRHPDEQRVREEHAKVQRPDPKDAPKPERRHVDPAASIGFAEQQRGDEVAAQDEEHVDAEAAGKQHAALPPLGVIPVNEAGRMMRHRLRGVREEHHEEGAEAEPVELRDVEAWARRHARNLSMERATAGSRKFGARGAAFR